MCKTHNTRDISAIRESLRKNEDFNTHGSLKGRVGNYLSDDKMKVKLSEDWKRIFRETADRIDYVIYSYDTPIAWHRMQDNGNPDFWIMPLAKYSVTTTKQQTTVKCALLELTDWSEKDYDESAQYFYDENVNEPDDYYEASLDY